MLEIANDQCISHQNTLLNLDIIYFYNQYNNNTNILFSVKSEFTGSTTKNAIFGVQVRTEFKLVHVSNDQHELELGLQFGSAEFQN